MTFCLSLPLAFSISFCLLCQSTYYAPHWASVSGFVIKKSHQSQQRADWICLSTPYRPFAYLLSTLSVWAESERERERQYSPLFLLCPLFMSHYSTRLTAYPIECPITAPKSFPFRFHCKTNVMSVVSQLISLSHLDCTQGMGLSLRVSSNAFNEKGVDCVDACLDVITSAWVRRQSLQSTPSASGIWYILGIYAKINTKYFGKLIQMR